MSKRIESSDVERRLAEARARVHEAGLPGLLSEVDRGPFGTTPLNLGMLDAVAEACAVAQAVRGVGIEDPLPVAFVLAEEAAERLGSLGSGGPAPEVRGALPGEQYADLSRGGSAEVFSIVLQDCASFVRFYQRHPDSGKRLSRDQEALGCLRSYFRLLSNTLRRLGPEGSALAVETPRLRFDGWKVFPAAFDEPNDLLPVKLEDVVGNEDYVKAATRLARDVAGFDLARGENPKKVRNQVLFVLGSPGCGKTVTAHAVLRDFLALCERHKLPAKARVIRRTDWASSYQNQSATRLLEIFREEVFNAPGVCGVYWPDIDTAFSARGDADIRQEEKAILGTLFGILDGTVGPKNGKWFLLCDANTVRMDEAVMSRLTQSPLEVRGPVAPMDFVRLLRDVKLRGKARWLPATEPEWLGIGELCVAEKLSGRSADSIAGRILTEIEDFAEPENYFELPFEEKQRLIGELARPVPAARIRALVSQHVRFEKDAEERSSQERFRQRVSEIHLHLSAQQAALGALAGKKAAAPGGGA
ncbi:MAG: hypothetical protein A2X36_13830 [Elusimicrobia bacterium GWA2_69_24]|nr:MAG: hypothetical protein A2X36_13830 [Elusimicrobia bacterium GWA2_69_24]HBL16181.1 hypothetical protein [Elusimicrobiota bacterium]